MSAFDVDILIPAGYTILPEGLRGDVVRANRKSSNEDLLIGLDKSMNFIIDPQTGKRRPMFYPVLRAALESKRSRSVTMVGSPRLDEILESSVWLIQEEARASGSPLPDKDVHFVEMYQPTERELRRPSPTKRMDLEQRCISQNLIRLDRRAPPSGIRLTIAQDLALLTGVVIDSCIDDVVPDMIESGAGIMYPLISKETLSRLGRFKRSYLRVIDDRFGTGLNKEDIYGRIRVKESNAYFTVPGLPKEFFEILGAFYSIRKMDNASSLFKSLDVMGMDAPRLGFPFGDLPKKMKALGRAMRVMSRFAMGELRISYAEEMADEIMTNTLNQPSPFFRFYEMKFPHFSHDIDSDEDLSHTNGELPSVLRANFQHVAAHPEDYLGKVVLVKGNVDSINFQYPRHLSRANKVLGYLASTFGYKEMQFSLSDGSGSMDCYRFKYRNLLFNSLFPAIVDRLYINDEESEFLNVESQIDSITTIPQLKYEEMIKHMEYVGREKEEIYVSGRVTANGLWLHEVIAPRLDGSGSWKKYYFKHHCPDPRCEIWKADQKRTVVGAVQGALNNISWSKTYSQILHKLRRDR